MPEAVVDIGSNSVRLFLCDADGRREPRGQRYVTITGLRRGAAADGAIHADALHRLDSCLDGYGARMRAAGVRRGVALGTSAVRDAPNRREVAAIVGRRLGLPLTVISGREEAALSFAGARLATPGPGMTLVLDVGGGSTELVRGDEHGMRGAVSLQVGAVRCTEDALPGDPPGAAALSALGDRLRAALADAMAEIGGSAPMVGVAGTVTTIAAIKAEGYHPDVVHRMVLGRADVDACMARLAAMTTEQRHAVPGLETARAGVIVAGVAIVSAAMHAAGVDELLVSERDLLDGVAIQAHRLCGEVGWVGAEGVLRDGISGLAGDSG